MTFASNGNMLFDYEVGGLDTADEAKGISDFGFIVDKNYNLVDTTQSVAPTGGGARAVQSTKNSDVYYAGNLDKISEELSQKHPVDGKGTTFKNLESGNGWYEDSKNEYVFETYIGSGLSLFARDDSSPEKASDQVKKQGVYESPRLAMVNGKDFVFEAGTGPSLGDTLLYVANENKAKLINTLPDANSGAGYTIIPLGNEFGFMTNGVGTEKYISIYNYSGKLIKQGKIPDPDY